MKIKKYIKLLKTLSSKTRLKIFLLLNKEMLCVCEISSILDMKQSRVSHALKKLSDANLIKNKRDGKWIIYSTDSKALNSEVVKGVLEEVKLPLEIFKKMKKVKKRNMRN